MLCKSVREYVVVRLRGRHENTRAFLCLWVLNGTRRFWGVIKYSAADDDEEDAEDDVNGSHVSECMRMSRIASNTMQR